MSENSFQGFPMGPIKKLINLTPHPITILGKDGRITIPRQPEALRIRTFIYRKDMVNYGGVTFPITQERYRTRDEDSLPPVEEGTFYVVSRTVAERYRRQRPDFLVVSGISRGPDGVDGCAGFTRFI